MVPKFFFSDRGLNYPASIRDDATRKMWVFVVPQDGRDRGNRTIIGKTKNRRYSFDGRG